MGTQATRFASRDLRPGGVANPSSRSYRRFLSSKAAAQQFGASAATIKTIKKYLAGKHLRGVVDKSRLFLRSRAR
ncbi:MAG: hypothetical protein KAZ48_10060 [Candidatus Nanopelagicales bacterium]|nr:hypothetical protein [Candidatus Nanopelagicales bacterium]